MPVSKSKRKGRKQRKVAAKFRSNFSGLGLPERATFIHNPTGYVKMSEVLMDFIGPYAAGARTEDDYHCLLSAALVAWNAALLPPEGRKEMMDELIDRAIPSPFADDARLVIHELIRRKDRYFLEINRGVLAYDLTMTKHGPHLIVLSTL